MKLDQISLPEEKKKEFYFFSWLLQGATFKETKLSQDKKTVLKLNLKFQAPLLE